MTNTLANEKKLMRNLDNIIKNYIKEDEELLQTLIEDDDLDKFLDIVGRKSDDGFLIDIVNNSDYDNFTNKLFERLKEIHESKILMLKQEQEKFKEFERIKGKKVMSKRKRKKIKLVAKKHNRMKWENKEINLVKRLVATNTQSGIIIKKLNEKRNENNMVSRTHKSVYCKIARLKKEEKEKGEK